MTYKPFILLLGIFLGSYRPGLLRRQSNKFAMKANPFAHDTPLNRWGNTVARLLAEFNSRTRARNQVPSSQTETVALTSTALKCDQVHSCAVCQSEEGNVHHVREMMLGMAVVFPYWECRQCGCFSLASVPDDLGRYYPSSYYSFQEAQEEISAVARLRGILRKLRDHAALSPVFFPLARPRRTDLDVIRRVHLTKSETLLDVGCGGGYLVRDLRVYGYNAVGIDPFVPEDLIDRSGICVQRKMLSDVDGNYDVILFRHSLEHMPINALRLARSRIKDEGVCIVCLPIIGWAWRHYGTDWAQLDAPRHLFIHTRKSFEILAHNSGFRIERVVFDSNEFQFWASEAYGKNIPLKDAAPPNRLQTLGLRIRATWLNRRGTGDAAQFYLRPSCNNPLR
jgi:hypothetical protein